MAMEQISCRALRRVRTASGWPVAVLRSRPFLSRSRFTIPKPEEPYLFCCSSLSLMASLFSCSLVLTYGYNELNCHEPPQMTSLAFAGNISRHPHVSCKMRQRNLGSQRKRQQTRKAPRDALLNNLKFRRGSSDEEVLTHPGDGVTSSSVNFVSNDDLRASPTIEENGGIMLSSDQKIMAKTLSVQIGDLLEMIKNAEKNILLLNESRVRALEEFDKIASEREEFLASIRNLEVKLDAQMAVADKEKMHLEFLEGQLEELKKEMSSMQNDGPVVREKDDKRVGSDSALSSYINSSLIEELYSLREENKLLKDDIQCLSTKLNNVMEIEDCVVALEDASKLPIVKSECESLLKKVEYLQGMLENAGEHSEQMATVLQQNKELQRKIDVLEASLLEADDVIRTKVSPDSIPLKFWSRILLTIDVWMLESKITSDDANFLREMAWNKDSRIHDVYVSCKGKPEPINPASFLKLASSPARSGLNVVHIAAEMAPVAKVGGLGDVVSGLGKALQRKGHLVEIVLPKYDCIQHEHISDFKVIDAVLESYFDGHLFKNKVWTGIVEGLPVFFLEPQHPAKFFSRGQLYGEHDDFKRFSYFSRAALELLYRSGKKPDIIHCHDWHTAFVAPLYWDVYAASAVGFNSARVCFTCHNFEYQGVAPASELASCGLDVHRLNRPDRLQDNFAHDKVNPIKGAIVYSNIVTTVSPTYSQEVRSAEGGHGLNETLNVHSKKFVGVLNGIDTDTWNPCTDNFLRVQYSADDLEGKAQNKDAFRKQFKLSTSGGLQPLVGCISRLVPQKGVHLIRHAIYRTLELGGQFVLLGSSPVAHIRIEYEHMANHFQNHPDVRLILKYDENLSHLIYAATDMLVIPSISEPCGLTQMIAMRYGSIPIVRKTGGLNDSVFDVDDDTVPVHYRNGFAFSSPDEQGLNSAMDRAFKYFCGSPDRWRQLVRQDMSMDFSWESPTVQYEELYEKAIARARSRASQII